MYYVLLIVGAALVNNVVQAEISGSELILTKGTNTGIGRLYITASTLTESVTDSFSVMTYPHNSIIYGFEIEDKVIF